MHEVILVMAHRDLTKLPRTPILLHPFDHYVRELNSHFRDYLNNKRALLRTADGFANLIPHTSVMALINLLFRSKTS